MKTLNHYTTKTERFEIEVTIKETDTEWTQTFLRLYGEGEYKFRNFYSYEYTSIDTFLQENCLN